MFRIGLLVTFWGALFVVIVAVGSAWIIRRRRGFAQTVAGDATDNSFEWRTRIMRIAIIGALAAMFVASVVYAGKLPRMTLIERATPDKISGIVVLDVSGSISGEHYETIASFFQDIVEAGAEKRFGLIVFSSDPSLRFFSASSEQFGHFRTYFVKNESGNFPSNPWDRGYTGSAFASGTNIGEALVFAEHVLQRSDNHDAPIILVSDLSDSGGDMLLLRETLDRFAQDDVDLRIVPLQAHAFDLREYEERFGEDVVVVGMATFPDSVTKQADLKVRASTFPWLFVALVIAMGLLLAVDLWWFGLPLIETDTKGGEHRAQGSSHHRTVGTVRRLWSREPIHFSHDNGNASHR